jgi:hypothetical protein
MERKGTIMTAIIIAAVMLGAFALSGCQPEQPQANDNNSINPLFNQSANNQIENLSQQKTPFVPFYVNHTARNDTKYEIAKDDVFSLSKGNLTSADISFLGVKLGDSYEYLLKTLGQPDTMLIPADKSYKNLNYRTKIGINSTESGITFHVENDTVEIITIRPSFSKYMQGNTSFGLKRDYFYQYFGEPNYMDFALDVYKVFHYMEKGVDIYLRADKAAIYSFYDAREFKGVNYVTIRKEIQPGVVVNVTEAVPIE